MTIGVEGVDGTTVGVDGFVGVTVGVDGVEGIEGVTAGVVGVVGVVGVTVGVDGLVDALFDEAFFVLSVAEGVEELSVLLFPEVDEMSLDS